jgi:murein DD-endopeptidase MepM/ murein hydrolase activator NlpD
VRRKVAAALVAVAAIAAGCRTARPPLHADAPAGRWYLVAPGDTLATIAGNAGIPAEDILEANGLARAEELRPGQLIFLLEPAPAEAPAAMAAAGPARLRWPLGERQVVVASPFGARGGRPHEGIDLPAPIGAPVFAAADGRVVYAGDGVRGYGNLVVIAHAGGVLTVYAHNSALLVAAGQTVRAGDRVALVGRTGNASGPHLHFEVREGQIPKDPMRYLPPVAGGGSP